MNIDRVILALLLLLSVYSLLDNNGGVKHQIL